MTRTRLCLFLILLTPLLVYWQTIFHDYGMRDDYSVLREAREEPGKIVHFTASQGRPLLGALLESSFLEADNVDNLCWLRLVSVLLLTVLGLALWRQLYVSGWTEVEAAAIGIGVTLLPSSQVMAGWAICWPMVMALLLSLAGFSAIETELERGGLKRVVALVGGCMIYTLAGLIYQSNATFAVLPIAAVLLVRTGREPMSDVKWLIMHLLTLIVGLGISFMLSKALFNMGIFHESTRMLIETHPFTKLGWFFWQPLSNALGLFALRDDFNEGAVIFWLVVILVVAVIGVACRLEVKGGVPVVKRRWIACLVVMPFLAHSVSLLAAERSTGYRVLFSLAGLVLLMAVYSLRRLTTAASLKTPLLYSALGLVWIAAAISAHRNSFLLIAEPQATEWDIVQSAVVRANATRALRVFMLTPTAADRRTERMFGDEFGSLSSDSEWVPREMFFEALHLRFPDKLPRDADFKLESGHVAPPATDYDLLIDLKKLKDRPLS